MKKIYIFFLFITTIAFAQEDAWVYFNAKSHSQIYFDSPLNMLSQRALDRRVKQNIIVDFKDVPIDPEYISQVKLVSGITVMARSKWLNAIHVRGSQSLINSIKTFSFVDKIVFANPALNSTGKKAIANKVKTNSNSNKTKVDYAYGSSANQIQMLKGHLLHQQNYTGSGKIIAIMDGGFPGVNSAQPFQRLRDNNQILGGYNFVARNPYFYTGNHHGTLVLSAIGGYKENALIGTAPDASFYLFITEVNDSENPIEESLWVEAAEKADSLGVDIINTSLGYFDYDNPAYSHTYDETNGTTAFISRGAEIAFSRGMIVVASAGNSNNDPTTDPHIAMPADAVSVLAIGAVSSTKAIASFSSIGPSFDGRVKPDVMSQGVAAVLSNELGNIVTANGTSFSSPIMAGMVACLWQAFPNKTNQEIRDLIIQSGDRYTTPSALYGYGIPDFNVALKNGLFIEDLPEKYFGAYPNPTNDLASLSFPESMKNGKIVIYNLLGLKILEKNITDQTDFISLKSLSNGIYFYKIESDTFSKSGKIIKN